MKFGKSKTKLSPAEKDREKLVKALGEDTVTEIEAMTLENLNKRIAEANAAISNTKAELDANPAYQSIKFDKSALETGFNEVKKRQNTIIKLSLICRQDRGAV